MHAVLVLTTIIILSIHGRLLSKQLQGQIILLLLVVHKLNKINFMKYTKLSWFGDSPMFLRDFLLDF